MHDWALAAGRVGGKVRQHHVASRGSVGLESPSYVTVRERSAVWQALHEAVAHHHIDADKATNLMATLQVRVPYPTPEQVGAAELQQAEHDAAFWQSMHGQTTKQIDLHKKLIAHAQKKIGTSEQDARAETAKADDAKARVARLANYRGAA
jgi:hypothetical protein